MASIATIGVYGFDRDSFLAALADAKIDLLLLKELAPTTELRQLQYREDARLGEGKRSRTALAPGAPRALSGPETLDRRSPDHSHRQRL